MSLFKKLFPDIVAGDILVGSLLSIIFPAWCIRRVDDAAQSVGWLGGRV